MTVDEWEAAQRLSQFARDLLPGPDDLKCSFCGEGGFDLVGLNGHLVNDCESFKAVEQSPRLFGGV